jgi:capsular polysaccharide export protein
MMPGPGVHGRTDTKMRVFLFLQGPSSPLFFEIAKRLEGCGHVCLRVNLNVGDWIFWRHKNGLNYRGRTRTWPAYLERLLKSRGITDLILLGEERPYHKVAVALAKRYDIKVHVVEMGYLRPDWVTFERDGMSSNSHFPRDPQTIIRLAEDLPEPDWHQYYRQSFVADAGLDLLYNLPNVLLWFLYPFYQRHALFHPLAEYCGWIGRLCRAKARNNHAKTVIEDRIQNADNCPYFVYPLQLQTDYQLRAHSDFRGQEEAIARVITSFAKHAEQHARLIVKIHPLDNGLIHWADVISRDAAACGIDERVDVVDGGNLDQLFQQTRGVVTVNSTAALPAIRLGKPVKVLGRAIYDIQGLTDQDDLDTFWTRPFAPNPKLAAAFFRLLSSEYQVRGNFYSLLGARAAADAITHKLEREQI